MKSLLIALCLLSCYFVAVPRDVKADAPTFANRIEGQIYDENRVPVGDMFVELQGDGGNSFATIKSTPQGRFTFGNLGPGTFRVRVMPMGRNYIEQSRDVQFVQSMTGRNDDTQLVEFYLRIDRRGMQKTNFGYPEAVFAQEIPDKARKLYQSGTESLDRSIDKGLSDLEAAITAFPIYFDALSRLGKEYLIRKDFEKAYPLLIRAIDVNQRSYSSYYALAYSFYQLKQIPAALKAASACTIIRPDAAEGRVLYGTLLRIHGDFQESEVELKKAIATAKTQNAEAHWQMALLYNRLNRNKDAADELEIFLKIAPAESADKKAAEALIAKLRGTKQS
ncbi:hypothetical protein BH10ACI2_BH10ACI2_22350 [soil metagenome]